MSELVANRFEIRGEIGRGSQAVTFRAFDRETGRVVALKELDFRRVEDWKSQELFEREGKTLQALDHPAIPRYVAAFAVEDDDSYRLFLAQEFVDGPTLAEELAGGKRWSEDELLADVTLLLEALRYLHERSPAVIHRDVKPSNIIRRADGRLALVDFGAVQNSLPQTVGGSTVIGTPGYMPMEQLMGRAAPASDLYALGATLVHLLTGTAPSALPVERNRMVFRDKVRVSPWLLRVLHKLTEPNIEDRYTEASEVVHDLAARFEPRSADSSDEVELEFDRPPSHWESLEETVRYDDSSGEIERVRFDDRTVNFPRWATVEPRAGGEFFMEFETYDADERKIRFELVDRPELLHIQAWRERDESKSSFGSLLVAAMIGAILIAFAPDLAPLTVAGLMGVLVWGMLTRQTPAASLELRVEPGNLELFRDGEFRLEASPNRARWRRDAEHSLRLNTGREVPAIELSPNQAYQVAWFENFIAARTREIAARSSTHQHGALDAGETAAPVVLDFDQDTLEAELGEVHAAEEHEPAQ